MGQQTPKGGIEKFMDPANNIRIEEQRALYKSEYKGKTYYFCGYSCKKRFDKNPEKFIPICWYHDLCKCSKYSTLCARISKRIEPKAREVYKRYSEELGNTDVRELASIAGLAG